MKVNVSRAKCQSEPLAVDLHWDRRVGGNSDRASGPTVLRSVLVLRAPPAERVGAEGHSDGEWIAGSNRGIRLSADAVKIDGASERRCPDNRCQFKRAGHRPVLGVGRGRRRWEPRWLRRLGRTACEADHGGYHGHKPMGGQTHEPIVGHWLAK
jgi:hypothetical protein